MLGTNVNVSVFSIEKLCRLAFHKNGSVATLGARDLTCAFSGFGQVVIVTRAEVLSLPEASPLVALAFGRRRIGLRTTS